MKKHNIYVWMLLGAFSVSACSTSWDDDTPSESVVPPTVDPVSYTPTSEATPSSPSSGTSVSPIDPHSKHTTYHYEAVAPTCTDFGNEEFWYCPIENKYYDTNPGGKILDSTLTKYDENNPYCLEAIGHTFDEWVIDTAATCEETGTRHRECSVCHAIENETIAKLGHAYSSPIYTWNETHTKYTATRTCYIDDHIEKENVGVDIVTVPATCTENGSKTYRARAFSKTYFAEEVRATYVEILYSEGHSMVHHPYKAQSCTEDGNIEYYYCTKCQKYFTDEDGNNELTDSTVIPASHSLVSYGLIEATCEVPGTLAHDTCTECGKHFINNEEVSADDLVINALGHNWNVSYSWNGDYTKCTVQATCTRNSLHTYNETVNRDDSKTVDDGENTTYYSLPFGDSTIPLGTIVVPNGEEHHFDSGEYHEATCTHGAYTVYTCTDSECDYSYVEYDDDHPQLDHNWGAVSYNWSTNNEQCTASRTCLNECGETLSQTVNTVYSVIEAPTCGGAGTGRYTATFSLPGAENQNKNVDIAALDHNWGAPTYNWNYDGEGGTVTATRVCATNPAHIETETIAITSIVTTAPTCTAQGVRTYTAGNFENEAFEDGRTSTQPVAATGHSMEYNEAHAATCNADGNIEYYHCTVCNKNFKDNAGNLEINGSVVLESPGHQYEHVVTPSTCLEAGYTTHTCSVCSDSYTDTPTAALGHNWSEPEYVWALDNSSVTASRTCLREGCEVVESETKATSNEVITPATEQAVGTRRYTVEFDNTAFGTKTKDVEIPKIGHVHSYGEVTYTWATDYSTCTASRECATCSDIELEVVDLDHSDVTTDPTCTETGVRTYYAGNFTNPAFEDGRTTTSVIDALGHDYDGATPTYNWVESGDTYNVTASISCQRDGCTYVLSETKKATLASTTPATCTEAGNKHFTVSFTNSEFTTQTRDDEIEILGHDWTDAQYEWSNGNTICVASHDCQRDGCTAHEEENGAVIFVTDTAANCTTDGVGHHEAIFVNPLFEAQETESEVIPQTGHDWVFVDYTFSTDGTSAVANFVCDHDHSHEKTEIATVTSNVITAATCSSTGLIRYTATYGSEAPDTTDRVLPIDSTAHGWVGNQNYWSGNNAVTGTVCEYDHSHTKNESILYTASTTYYDYVCSGALSTVASSPTTEKKYGDINLFFSNTDSSSDKYSKRSYKTTIKVNMTHSHIASPTVNDLFFVKLDNGYTYGSGWYNTGSDYLIFNSDATCNKDSNSGGFRNYSPTIETTGGMTLTLAQYLEMTENCEVIITITYNGDSYIDSSNNRHAYFTISYTYYSHVTHYEDYFGYTQSMQIELGSDKNWNYVNCVRIARNNSDVTMKIEDISYSLYDNESSTNIDRDIVGFTNNGNYKTTIVDVAGKDSIKKTSSD